MKNSDERDTEKPTLTEPSVRELSSGRDVSAHASAPIATGDNGALARILGNVTHELKTPLHSMMAVAQLLHSEVDGSLNDEQKKQVSMIIRNGEQLLELITNLLQYTNLESRTQTPHFESFSPKLLFSEIAQTIEPLASKQKIKFEKSFESLTDSFVSDRTLVRLIASNLISNALKFSPPHSTLSFYVASLHSGALLVEVADSGIGIPVESQQRIFGEFFQMESSESRRFGGVGLGLSLVKSAVKALEGKIELRSESGQGSLFRVTIPSAAEKLETLKILLHGVDDNTAIAIEEAVRSERHTAERVNQDELRAQSEKADLIFLEGRDAQQIIQLIRANTQDSAPERRPRVIVLSAVRTAEEQHRALQSGADAFLAKPFDLSELFTLIATQQAGMRDGER